jgi:hypothetical protein
MALPKFTTTPTPLYQQQPIIKRPNYSEIYLRNFAAAEASMANSFGKIADRLDKIALEKEKKKERELKARRDEFETNKGIDNQILSITKNLNNQNRAKAVELFSTQADALKNAYVAAKDSDTGKEWKQVETLSQAFFGNISLFSQSMDNIEKWRGFSQTNDMDAIYSDYQVDNKYNAFRDEIITNDGFDIGFGLDEVGQVEIQYTDNASGDKMHIDMDDLSAMNLEDWGIKQTDWGNDKAHENQQFTALHDSIGGGTAGVFLHNAHNSLDKKTIVNQQSAIDENGKKITGFYDTSTMTVKKYPEIYKRGITKYAYGNLNGSLTPEQKAKIFHDKIATSGIENEADNIAKEMINLSEGEYTDEDFETLKTAVLAYGPGKTSNEELKNNPIYAEVHGFINTKVVSWATDRFWHTKYGKNEDTPPKPTVKRKIELDEATAEGTKRLNFLENISGSMKKVRLLGEYSLSKNKYSEIQSILNGLGDTYGISALKNYQGGAQIDSVKYNELYTKYIKEDGMSEEAAEEKADEKAGKIVGKEGGFVYTDKTQQWEIFKMIMNDNKLYDLSDKEAQKLYNGWVKEIHYNGDNNLSWGGEEVKDYWSKWLGNEKVTWQNDINKIYGDQAKYFEQFLKPE